MFIPTTAPDNLNELAIRFVNNLHKPQSPRSGFVSKDFLSSGLKIKSFTVNNIKYEINSDDWSTVEKVKLKSALKSKSKAEVKIEWEYPLSVQSGREGQIDPETFYVAYSFPRISVYDDYNGWDMLQHSDRQNFTMISMITVLPSLHQKNYVVWATGDFLNPEAVLQPEYLKGIKLP